MAITPWELDRRTCFSRLVSRVYMYNSLPYPTVIMHRTFDNNMDLHTSKLHLKRVIPEMY